MYSAQTQASRLGQFAAVSLLEANANFGVEMRAAVQDLQRLPNCGSNSLNAEISCVHMNYPDVCLEA